MRVTDWSGVLLQLSPAEIPFVWYLAGFILTLLITASLLGIYLVRTEINDQGPIGAEDLINAFEEPLVVLSEDHSVLTANVPFRTLFRSDITGESIETVLEDVPALREAITERETRTVILDTPEGEKHYNVKLYPAGREPRPPRKWIVLLQDVTAEHEKHEQLEAQNEKLNNFASLISHDLRNPLDVAIGRTNAVKEELDDEELRGHLEGACASHDRMQQIITDVLALAREGHSIGEIEAVELRAAAEDAWSYVDTADATLTVETDMAIRADRERLTRTFENLFRNAVQHAGSETTVRIGAIEDPPGFFVADDGEGVPADQREAVLEAGYTAQGDGTGLGLAIVTGIADAHGWNVAVTEADAGGARFEFTAVERVADSTPQQVE